MTRMLAYGMLAMAPSLALAQTVPDAGWVVDFKRKVQSCWLPPDDPQAVTVGFKLAPDGSVIGDSLRSIPREMEITPDFMAAKRAILRCGRDGFDLPAEQYDRWKDIEMTFDPAWRTGAME